MSDIKLEIVNEIHKPARKNFKRRRVIIKGLNDLFQADLVEMIPYAKINRGNKYILTVIDVFSKFAWAVPLKSKTAKDVSEAMAIVLQPPNIPRNLQTDLGREFYNKPFGDLMSKLNINHYSSFSSLKASVVERFNRTIKSELYKNFSYYGNYNWINHLDDILQRYNTTRHHTTLMKPVQAIRKSNEKKLLNSVYSNIKVAQEKNSFKINDIVRISKFRQQFDKSYTPNWSNELFTIKRIKYSNPTTYILEDSNHSEIKGHFYAEELQKTNFPGIYLIEKVIRKRGSKVYVKWLGLNEKSWINAKELITPKQKKK